MHNFVSEMQLQEYVNATCLNRVIKYCSTSNNVFITFLNRVIRIHGASVVFFKCIF